MTSAFTELTKPDVSAECPAIPAGATDWERQEANQRLLAITRAAHDETHGMAVYLLKAEASAAQLDMLLDGIRHRLALVEREA